MAPKICRLSITSYEHVFARGAARESGILSQLSDVTCLCLKTVQRVMKPEALSLQPSRAKISYIQRVTVDGTAVAVVVPEFGNYLRYEKLVFNHVLVDLGNKCPLWVFLQFTRLALPTMCITWEIAGIWQASIARRRRINSCHGPNCSAKRITSANHTKVRLHFHDFDL